MTDITIHIHVTPKVPVMTYEKFGEETGLDQKGRKANRGGDSQVVEGLGRNNHIPTTRLGKYRVVNLVEYTAELAVNFGQKVATDDNVISITPNHVN